MDKSADFQESWRELLTSPVPDVVEDAYTEAMHMRFNGQIHGTFKPLTPFLRDVIELPNVDAFRALLAPIRQTDFIEGARTKALNYKGCHALGLWETACGNHVIKRVSDDDVYILYAQLALLNPDLPLVPRIDAIIETKNHGVFIVMEKLYPLESAPENISRAFLSDKLDNTDGIKDGISGCVLPAIARELPAAARQWTAAVQQVVDLSGAEFDDSWPEKLIENTMLRRVSDGYEPVLIDPLWSGGYLSRSHGYMNQERKVKGSTMIGDRIVFSLLF